LSFLGGSSSRPLMASLRSAYQHIKHKEGHTKTLMLLNLQAEVLVEASDREGGIRRYMKSIDLTISKRVFILGPSHHVYFKGGMLTPFHIYETPLGDVPVDRTTTDELNKTGIFKIMSKSIDEDEHSFEMHMPLVYKMTASSEQGVRPIVPILIGTTDSTYDTKLAKVLAPYFANKENAFIISTDFCHLVIQLIRTRKMCLKFERWAEYLKQRLKFQFTNLLNI